MKNLSRNFKNPIVKLRSLNRRGLLSLPLMAISPEQEHNLKKSFFWFKKAGEQGYAPSKRWLKTIRRQIMVTNSIFMDQSDNVGWDNSIRSIKDENKDPY